MFGCVRKKVLLGTAFSSPIEMLRNNRILISLHLNKKTITLIKSLQISQLNLRMKNIPAKYSSWTDSELLLGIQSGDYAAFTEIYNRFIDKLHTYSQKIKLDTIDREDVIQEVFSSLWIRREDLAIDNLAAWLYMAVRKQSLYQLRKKKYQDQYMANIINFVTPFFDPILGTIQEKELQRFLDQELSKMPPRAQEIFRMSRNDFLTYKEIAQKLDISEATVRKQVQNVLKVFRYKLGPRTLEGLLLAAILFEKK